MLNKNKKTSLLMLMAAALSLSGCKGDVGELQEDFEDDGLPYEIVYYMPYNDSNTPQNLAPVQQKLSQVLKRKINATIKIIPYTYQEYTSKMSGVIAANLPFDVCFTSPDVNPYITNVQREAFLPLNKLLPKFAPQTWAAIKPEIWQQAKVDGKIYGSVNEQIFPRTFGYDGNNATVVKKFLDEKYNGIGPDEVYTLKMDAFDFMKDYLKYCRDHSYGANGKIHKIDTNSAMLSYYCYDDLGTGMYVPGAVKITEEGMQVVNQFDTADYKHIVDLTYELKAEGYLDEGSTLYDLTPDSTWKPGYKIGKLFRLSTSHYFTSYVVGSMNAISSTSKNPARAMKFIELLRTDPEVHNLIQFGVEDQNYILDSDNPNRIEELVSGSGYNNSQFGWGLGTEFISLLTPGQADDQWEKVQEINNTTPVSKLIGFNFDASSVKQKISDCKAVSNQYIPALESGEYKNKESAYAEFISKLNAAGAREIIEEKQRQLDAYLSSLNESQEVTE